MDFSQGKFAKIHDFCMDFSRMSDRLHSLSKKYPSGLVMPIIENDLNSPTLAKMIPEINQCDYLQKVFIALSAQTPEAYEQAVRLFRDLKIPCDIIWCNKPQVNAALEDLKKTGLDVTKLSGKGKDLWIAMGIASLDLYALIVHDADILSYSKMLPTKMLYPVIEPRLDFFFSKGYYARVNTETGRMYGRIYRLFINPILEALKERTNLSSRFIEYLQSFSYPLSGEFAIYSDLATHLRIPSDWGLEIGMLAELFRNASYGRICEVDLGLYDHKHREVITNGLLKTAEDSLVTLLRTMTETDGIEVTSSYLKSLQVVYRRFAQDKIAQYHADATCNGLDYDRHEEESAVDSLSEVILSAGEKFLLNPAKTQLPGWLRTIAAIPNIREKLREAAIED